MQSLQNIAPINGKPSVYGDGFLGVIRAFPDFAGLDEDNAEKALAQGFGRCKMRRRSRDGSIEEVEQRVTVDAAKKAGWWGKAGPWTTTPGRMLQWRARAWAGRDLFADRLCGIGMAEEAMDCVVEATATVVDMMPRATVEATPPVVEATTTVTPPPRSEPRKVPKDADRVPVKIIKAESGGTGVKTDGSAWVSFYVTLEDDKGRKFTAVTFSDTLGPEMMNAAGMHGVALLTPGTKPGSKPQLHDMEPATVAAPASEPGPDDVPY